MVIGVFVFLLVVLNCIVGFGIYDASLLPRLLALMIFLALAVPLFAWRKVSQKYDAAILRDPLVICFGAYTLLTWGSLLFAINVTGGFNDLFKTFGTFVVLCLACLILPETPRWPSLLARIVIVAAFVTAGIGYYQMFMGVGFKLPNRTEAEAVTGLMSNVNLYAGFLNLMLPFCLCGLMILCRFWRAAAGVASLATILLIVLLQSRAAYISLAAGSLVAFAALILFRKSFGIIVPWRAMLVVVVAFLCLIIAVVVLGFGIDNPVAQRFGTLFTRDFSSIDGGRLMIWRLTLEMIQDHFFTGVGAGNFTIRMHEYLGRPDQNFSGILTNWAQPHNDFLWVFSEKGVFGFLAFVGFIAVAYRHFFSALRSTPNRDLAWISLFALMGLTSYITASCFDFPLERINQQVYLALLLAIATCAARHPLAAQGKSWVHLHISGLAVLAVLLVGAVYSVAAIRQEYYVNLARRAIRKAEFPIAVANARLAATPWKTLDPVATPVSFLEGYAFWKMGKTREALPLLERARRENPNRVYVLQTLAEVYYSAGKRAESLECINLAAIRYPGDKDVQATLLRIYQAP